MLSQLKLQIKPYKRGVECNFSCSLEEMIPKDSSVRLVDKIVDKLDLSLIFESYKTGGCSIYEPRMLLKVIFYAYMNNIFSCRQIAKALKENVNYMWLSGCQYPSFRTINRFRSCHLKEQINSLFTQVVWILVEKGVISLKTLYIDGTKLESVANKYTFVWKKSVERNKERLIGKINDLLDGLGLGKYKVASLSIPTQEDFIEIENVIQGLKDVDKTRDKQIKTLQKEYIPKLMEYCTKLGILGTRNSYSKTDTSATFQRMKEDAMNNGQTKPGYNLQIATQNQYLVNFAFYPNPTDTATLIPFLSLFWQRFARWPIEVCADAGYGSLENYHFLKKQGIMPYVKYNYFHLEAKRSFKKDIFRKENYTYDSDRDLYFCPFKRHLHYAGVRHKKTREGYEYTYEIYKCECCLNCPLREKCNKTENDKIISVNHVLDRYKHTVRELLESVHGRYLRSKRPVEVEAVFGQIKYDRYYKRLRHRGMQKVIMDFGILAIAFNIAKLYKRGYNRIYRMRVGFICIFVAIKTKQLKYSCYNI